MTPIAASSPARNRRQPRRINGSFLLLIGAALLLGGCFPRDPKPIADVEVWLADMRHPETFNRLQLIHKFRYMFQTKCVRGPIFCRTRIGPVSESHFDVTVRERIGSGDLQVGYVHNLKRRTIRIPFGPKPIMSIAGDYYRIDMDGRPFLVSGRREALNIYTLLNRIAETAPDYDNRKEQLPDVDIDLPTVSDM